MRHSLTPEAYRRTGLLVVLLLMMAALSGCGAGATLPTPTVLAVTPTGTSTQAPDPPTPTAVATSTPTGTEKPTTAPTVTPAPDTPEPSPTAAVTNSATPTPQGAEIVLPKQDAQLILPLHILARLGAPDDQITAELLWEDGTKLTDRFTLLDGGNGKGLLIGNLNWINMLQPPEPKTQGAVLELKDAAGKSLASKSVQIISPTAENSTQIKLFWEISGAAGIVQPETRTILKTPDLESTARQALEELLWGPPRISQVGFITEIPLPEQVLTYPGRQPDWEPRVTLLDLKIENGVVTADFSKEMRAYGGGSARVTAIRGQITQTLMQFPEIRQVVISVEGQTGDVLQP